MSAELTNAGNELAEALRDKVPRSRRPASEPTLRVGGREKADGSTSLTHRDPDRGPATVGRMARDRAKRTVR